MSRLYFPKVNMQIKLKLLNYTKHVQLLVLVCRQETCDNDDDFTVGWRDELPPGVQGCLRPQSPPNSFLRVSQIPEKPPPC